MTRIVAISDTHQLHNYISIPDGDILIHSGDFTSQGQDQSIIDFINWFNNQPHKYKVFIAGNHEENLDKGPHRARKLNIIDSFVSKNPNLFYLENSAATINNLKFYGSPVTPFFFNWAWNVNRGPEIANVWSLIPDDTEILITHGPPYGILDLVLSPNGRDPHQGCADLLNKVLILDKLKLHVFGHLHYQGGNQTQAYGKTFANAAILDDSYAPIHKPVVIDI
jgi:Icc-related predicted phosphoesterase